MRVTTLFLALVLGLLGASCRRQDASAENVITVWANSAATTPVLPLYALGDPNLQFQDWNTNVAFQSLLLAGDGVLWVGQTETLVRAAQHGAPLKLLAVTGWRKWQILSKNPADRFPQDFQGKSVPFAPSDGAGRFLLEALLKEQGVSLTLQPMDAKPMMLKAVDGQLEQLILPEPFATAVMKKNLGFNRISSLEEYYGQCRHCQAVVPWAAIAVNRQWADEHPERVRQLLDGVVEAGGRLAQLTPSEVAEYWPEGKNGIQRAALAESLERDPVRVVPAGEALPELRDFLQVVAPGMTLTEDMIWR